MSLKKIKEPDITKSLPWEFDPLERRREGELLTRLIKSLTGSYVIAVKAKWGSGKTVFLERLSHHLENNDVPVISINAWRNDYLEYPMIAFLAAIKNRLKPDKSVNKKIGGVISGLAKHGVKLIAPATSVAANLLLPGAGVIVNAGSKALEDAGTHLLNWESARRNAESDFRKKLEDARNILTNRKKGSEVKPVVVVIDELDRCRPDFSIKVLERIKHFFDIDGMIFVIATDGINLPNSVSSVYGEKVVGEEYLRKFFDFEYQLEDPSPEKFVSVLANQFGFDLIISESNKAREYFLNAYSEIDTDVYSKLISTFNRGMDVVEIVDAFPIVSKLFKLSLRDQAQAFTVINAYLRTASEKAVIFPQVIVFGICLRFFRPGLYEDLRDGIIDLQDVFNNIQNDLGGRFSKHLEISSGKDVMLFQSAVKTGNVKDYASNALQGARNSNPINSINFAAAKRFYTRAQAVDFKDLKTYLSRSLKLTDAFL